MTPRKVVSWVGAIIGAGGAITLLFWGVPFYLKSTVHDLYAAEAAAAAAPAGVGTNSGAIAAIQAQLTSMEARMIARDKIQADRDAVIMQYFADKAAAN